MKKIFKFRGKDENNGNYVYGDLCNISSVISTPSIINKNGERIFVKSDSVAQLIGYDKAGNEVYGDDILIDENYDIEVNAMEALEMWEFGEEFYNYKLKGDN